MKINVSTPPFAVTVDTQENILALPAKSGELAYANDTEEFYIADGTSWFKSDIPYKSDAQAPDMGYESDSARSGYHPDYITNKILYNIAVRGHPATAVNGSFRTDATQDPDTLEIYLRDAWQTIIYDLTTEYGDFRHAPVSEEIYVWRGASVVLGLNSRPIVNEYKVSMGAYPIARVMNGGTF